MKTKQQENRSSSGWQDSVLRRLNKVRGTMFPTSASRRAGMGAIPYNGGTTFRVWAPHAKSVAVAGSFNHWSHYRTPLASEGNGNWSADVSQARPGHEYKFVIRHKGKTLVRTDPYARVLGNRHDNGVIVNGLNINGRQSSFHRPLKQDWVIYEIHVGSFGENAERVPAKFAGVIEKLPYLRDLGINAIELMPVMDFSGEISWGYNPSHPFAVSAAYGGREALVRLIEAAHDHGIAVIIDVVYNHFGPQDLSLWQFDGWQQNNLGGVYFYNDWRAETPWGHTRPDYGRPEVRQYIRDNALMWLESFGADGLRWDATAYIRNVHGYAGDTGSDIPEGWALMQWINNELHAGFPGAISIAEDLQNNSWVARDTGGGGAGFDSQWAADFVHPVRQAIITPDDANRDMAAVARAISPAMPSASEENKNGEGAILTSDYFTRVIYTESHDEVANGKARVPEEIAPGNTGSAFARLRSTLGAAIVFTSPGIPLIFQGQEFLEDGWFDDQQLLDWGRARENRPITQLYHDLIELRRNLCDTTAGLSGEHVNIFNVDNNNKVIAYHRWNEGGAGDDTVIVANFGNRVHEAYRIGVPHGGKWTARFRSTNPAYGLYSSEILPEAARQMVLGQMEWEAAAPESDGMAQSVEVVLAPYEVVVLSQ